MIGRSNFNRNDLILVKKRQEPSCPIAPGAAVMLNSGSANMLVVSIADGVADLAYVRAGEVVRTELPLACLTLLGDVEADHG